jgi:glycerate dehydrogenase
MAIKVVVVDAAALPGGVDFPPLNIDKYGWEQYPRLSDEEIAERCWRADIVITLTTGIRQEMLQKMIKLGLLICTGKACDLLDQAAARQHGVELLAFPDARLNSVEASQDVCNRIAAAIDHYVQNFETGE